MTHVPCLDARILPDSTTRMPSPTADTATVTPLSCQPRRITSIGLGFVWANLDLFRLNPRVIILQRADAEALLAERANRLDGGRRARERGNARHLVHHR